MVCLALPCFSPRTILYQLKFSWPTSLLAYIHNVSYGALWVVCRHLYHQEILLSMLMGFARLGCLITLETPSFPPKGNRYQLMRRNKRASFSNSFKLAFVKETILDKAIWGSHFTPVSAHEKEESFSALSYEHLSRLSLSPVNIEKLKCYTWYYIPDCSNMIYFFISGEYKY